MKILNKGSKNPAAVHPTACCKGAPRLASTAAPEEAEI